MLSVRDLSRRIGHYAIASVASILTGLVSYPLFTRKLAVEDYGAMGLIQVILLLGVATAKLGLQHSIVRLWPVHDRGDDQRAAFHATFLFGALALSLVVTTVCLAANAGFGGHLQPRLRWPLAVATLLIPCQTLFSFAQNLLRAQERSRTYVVYTVSTGVLGLVFAALLVVWIMPPAWRHSGYYLGLLAAEMLVLLLLLRATFLAERVRVRDFDWSLMRASLWFGAPLIVFELSSLALLMGDRVVIEIFWSERQLGYYTAAFSLAWQIASVCTLSFDMAAVPMYTNLFEREGRQATREFLGRGIRVYYLLALPMIAGLWAVREDIIVVLASHKYRAAQTVVPLLIASFLVFGARTFLGAGLFLAKRSRLIATIALGGALFGLGLNLVLVPRYGIEGSAVGSLLGSLATNLVLTVLARRALSFDVGLRRLLLYAAGAAGMAVVVSRIRFVPLDGGDFSQHLAQLVVRVLAGVVVYALFALAVEPRARVLLAKSLARAYGR